MKNTTLTEKCDQVQIEVTLKEEEGRPQFYCPDRGAELNAYGIHCNKLNGQCKIYPHLIEGYLSLSRRSS
jgi:hypothetical protein